MRFPLPRAKLCFGLLLMVCTFFIARDARDTLSRPSAFTQPEKRQETGQLYGSAAMFLLGLILSLQSLTREYALGVRGENFTETIQLRGGEMFEVGPLRKLAGTALIVALRTSGPTANRPQFRSFRLYRGPLPQDFEPKFGVQLLGRSGGRDTVLAREIWPESVNGER